MAEPLSPQFRLARWAARTFQKPLLARSRSPWIARARTEIAGRLVLRHRAPFSYRSDRLGGVPVRRLDGRGATVLHLHGGGYMFFSARTHQGLAAALAKPLGASAVLPHYRRAPEHPFPAALDDAEAVYRCLAGPVILSGDSAGGGLAMALLHRILAQGLKTPKAVLAFSPWADLSLSGASLVRNAPHDALLPAAKLPEVAAAYAGETDPRTPDLSPIYGDFKGAPPVLIQAAGDEILLSDAETLAKRLEEVGGPVTLSVRPRGLHAGQVLTGWVPEADQDVAEAVAFMRDALG